MISDREARDLLEKAVASLGESLPWESLDKLQAQARFEGSYGYGWVTPQGVRYNPQPYNWGAIKAPPWKAPCSGDTFEAIDGGEVHCFRRYKTPYEGALGFVRLIYKVYPGAWDVLRRGGSSHDYAWNLKHPIQYYGVSVEAYERALEYRAGEIRKSLGSPPVTSSRGFGPLILIGLTLGFLGTVGYVARKRKARVLCSIPSIIIRSVLSESTFLPIPTTTKTSPKPRVGALSSPPRCMPPRDPVF